jgi:hypothetical protein
MPEIWPDERLEREMLQDVSNLKACGKDPILEAVAEAVCCHVRSLLERVRALERERGNRTTP